MKTILELYKKEKFSELDNDIINEAIENFDIETQDIKENFMDYVYERISGEEILEYTDENYDNGLTHKENYNNLLKYLQNENNTIKYS